MDYNPNPPLHPEDGRERAKKAATPETQSALQPAYQDVEWLFWEPQTGRPRGFQSTATITLEALITA